MMPRREDLRHGKLPYLTERDGFLGVVTKDGQFRKLRKAGPVPPVTKEWVDKHIFQRWAEALKRLANC